MILDRLGKALQSQKRINQLFVEDILTHDTLLHRAEYLLEDDLDFEFSHTLLSDLDYSFLHMYTSSLMHLLGQIKPLTYHNLVRILQAATVTMPSVERFDKANSKYDPQKDNISFLPRKDLTLFEKIGYDFIPLVLVDIQMSQQYQIECENEQWRNNVLTSALSFITNAHVLLLKRGLGDRG